MLEILQKTLFAIYSVITLPLKWILGALYYIYSFIFLPQFYMHGMCVTLFGSGYGCDILNPDYVFTTILFNTIRLVAIVTVLLKIWNLWYYKK